MTRDQARDTLDDGPPLDQELFDDAPSFGFFQAVRLLRLSDRRSGRTRSVNEVVRFRSHPSLEFPASAVYDLARPRQPDGPPLMTVNFFGLYGPNGVLPRHYTEILRRLATERRDPERNALRDWLDLFNHRFLALFYRAWEKYRFWLAPEQGAWTRDEPDTFTLSLLSLIGLGTKGMRNRFQVRAVTVDREPPPMLGEVRDLALLRYAGLLAQRKRNAWGLESMLSDFFGYRAQVLQFHGCWLTLPADGQTRLGESLETCELGVTAIAGDRVWDVESKLRIRLGPLTYAQFLGLLPETQSATCKAIFLVSHLVRFYLGPQLDWEVQLVLRHDEVPPCQLSDDAPGARLGWNTWLDAASAADAEDAVFSAEECS
jgi:type VI secretion system protein ImpH